MNSDLWNRQITADVVKDQRDSVCANIGSHTYYFSFSRERIEIERVTQTQYPEFSAQHERMARFSQFITYYEEHQQGDGSVIYDVGITISPGQALQVLSNRSVQLQWGVRDDWPKKRKNEDTPPIGIGFYPHFRGPEIGIKTDQLGNLNLSEQHSIREKLMERHLGSAEIWVSSEYQVYNRYRDGEIANKEDFHMLRLGLWHEIMEIVIAFIATEAFCFPFWMYRDMLPTEERGEGAENFAHNAVMAVQASIQNDQNLWLYWGSDPPFDAFESAAFSREDDAEYAISIAKAMEEVGNWAAAYERWIEAERALEIAIREWKAVPHHPDREDKINQLQEKLSEAKERKAIAKEKAGR